MKGKEKYSRKREAVLEKSADGIAPDGGLGLRRGAERSSRYQPRHRLQNLAVFRTKG